MSTEIMKPVKIANARHVAPRAKKADLYVAMLIKIFLVQARVKRIYSNEIRLLLTHSDVLLCRTNMIDRTLQNGVQASYVLTDTWFTHAPLIRAVRERGLDVIGMVKDNNQRYPFHGHTLSLKELYKAASIKKFKRTTILRSITTTLSGGGVPTFVGSHTPFSMTPAFRKRCITIDQSKREA